MKARATNRSGRRNQTQTRPLPPGSQLGGAKASAPMRAELAANRGRVITIHFNPENRETEILLQVSRVFPPKREYLFGVAQIVNLLHRRLPIGSAVVARASRP